MTEQEWTLKGNFYECCRINGHCPLWFGRDLTDGPCVNLATRKVTAGQIQNVDMKGVIFTYANDGISAKSADGGYGNKGIKEGVVYVGNNASEEQKEILESFLPAHIDGSRWEKSLGVKFTDIEIKEEDGDFRITSPYFEVHMIYTVGKDKTTPVRMENARPPIFFNVRFCHTLVWKWKDFGKDLEFRQTSGAVADFVNAGSV